MNGLRHEILLHIKDVSLTIGQNQILSHVNAEIHNIEGHGQVVALLGRSGCGKTSLFMVNAGLWQPTEGQVLIGRECALVHPGMVGVVFQNYPLLKHRTVLGNLLVAARQKGGQVSTAKERVAAILERFQLTDRQHAYPAQLSGGQRQRVAIARQLLCSDHFLLMDEPFSGLDPVMKENVCHLLTEVASDDDLNTIVLTTHDIGSALAVADEIWLMSKGQIVESYDLIDLGLAWHPELIFTPEFAKFEQEIRGRFRSL